VGHKTPDSAAAAVSTPPANGFGTSGVGHQLDTAQLLRGLPMFDG
jgi:hypothetical protein